MAITGNRRSASLRRLGLAATAALALLSGSALTATAQDAPSEPSTTVTGVTVTAPVKPEASERSVVAYVAGVTSRRENYGLARWHDEVCPIVAGLPKAQGEAALAWISQVVLAAGAPLATGKCQPNFYVVLTAEPAPFVRDWKRRNPNLFADGLAAELREFVETDRPVRSWYQIAKVTGDAMPPSSSMQLSGTNFTGIKSNARATHSRLEQNGLRGIKAALVVIDADNAKGLTVAQLADYGALVGLTELRLGSDVGDAPTVLSLFGDKPNAADGLTPVDTAFLNALYNTSPKSRLQRSEIATRVQTALR